MKDWSISVDDVCPRPIGVEVAGGGMQRLIDKNQRLPFKGEFEFPTVVDDQPNMTFNVYEGDSPKAKDNYFMT